MAMSMCLSDTGDVLIIRGSLESADKLVHKNLK